MNTSPVFCRRGCRHASRLLIRPGVITQTSVSLAGLHPTKLPLIFGDQLSNPVFKIRQHLFLGGLLRYQGVHTRIQVITTKRMFAVCGPVLGLMLLLLFACVGRRTLYDLCLPGHKVSEELVVHLYTQTKKISA